MRVLVCGGRNYLGDVSCLAQIDISILIHGCARGADTLAAQWAINNGIHVAGVPALWGYFDKASGYRRNSAMMTLQPEYCVAFPGGNGTAMMVKLCEKKEITVWKPY